MGLFRIERSRLIDGLPFKQNASGKDPLTSFAKIKVRLAKLKVKKLMGRLQTHQNDYMGNMG